MSVLVSWTVRNRFVARFPAFPTTRSTGGMRSCGTCMCGWSVGVQLSPADKTFRGAVDLLIMFPPGARAGQL